MAEMPEKIRYILQFYFDKGENATKARNKICAVYGEDALSISTAQKWFVQFRAGNLDVKDAARSGRPITEKINEILNIIHENPHITAQSIAAKLDISQTTVLRHLHEAGFTKKDDVWVTMN